MLKSLSVDNFKSLNNFNIQFSPATFIIGANASGKSTVLNAIVFLKYCCSESASVYLEKHHITVADLCSKLSKKRTIALKAVFQFDDKEISWNIEFTASKADNSLVLSSETISDGRNLLYYSQTDDRIRTVKIKSYRVNELTGDNEEIIRGDYKSSHLSIIGKDSSKEYPGLYRIKNFFDSTEPFDLLSPKDMRESTRGTTNSIGRYGEKLAAFIKGLSTDERQDLTGAMQEIFPNIMDVKAVVRGRPGWTSIDIEEKYSDQHISVSSRNMSDGMIRLIAFFAMRYHKTNGGVTLLDEIENGINSEVMADLLKAFQANGTRNGQQFIATTHNTVLLDYIEPGNIRYLSRDKQGNTIAISPFSIPKLKEKLDYMYPGEIILNTPNEELDALVNGNEEVNQ